MNNYGAALTVSGYWVPENVFFGHPHAGSMIVAQYHFEAMAVGWIIVTAAHKLRRRWRRALTQAQQTEFYHSRTLHECRNCGALVQPAHDACTYCGSERE